MIRKIYFAAAFTLLWLSAIITCDAVGVGQISLPEGYTVLAALFISAYTTYQAYKRGRKA